MNNILEINQLTKRFGRITAVDQLEISVPRGAVFGLLGPNGSGKSTTLGMILGVVNPSAGSFTWFGEPPTHHHRQKIGAILEAPSFYHYLSAEQNLRVVCEIKQTPPERIKVVLERVGLAGRAKDAFRTYSLGMKQRLAIASALLADPEVLILDEPTNGLDPQGIADMRNLIIDLANEGRTIILASHLLDEVQKICDSFAVLRMGKKVFQGSVAALNQEILRLRICAADMDRLMTLLPVSAHVASARREGAYAAVALKPGHAIADFHRELISAGVVLTLLKPEENTLEQKFLEILKSGSHD